MNLKQLDWDNIKYFIALIKYESLSLTATQLNIKHTTVARRITQLEEQLKLKLFHRLAKGWILTEEGLQLAKVIEPLKTEWVEFERKLASLSEHIGAVKISAPVLIMSHFILPLLKDLDSDNKLYQINLELISSMENKNIVNGEIDIALRLGKIDNLNLTQKLLCNIEYGIYGHKDYIAQAEQLNRKLNFIGFSEEYPNTPQKKWLIQQNTSDIDNLTININDMNVILEAVKKGIGLGILPSFIGKQDTNLIELPFYDLPKYRPLYLVMHSDIKRSERVRIVADLIIESFKSI